MNNPHPTIRLLLADDHPATRAGIRVILARAPDILVVGEAQDGYEAQRLVAKLRPHILLLDLQMPGPRPSEVEKWVRVHYPETINPYSALARRGRSALGQSDRTRTAGLDAGGPGENRSADCG